MEGLTTDIRPPDLHDGQMTVMRCKQKRRIVIGANFWGHTTMGILDVLWCARGDHPYRRVESSPSQFWICAPSYDVHRRVHWPAFEKHCRLDWIAHLAKKKRYVDIKRANGGTCRIWFHSTNPNSWRTLETRTEVNGVWIDGPPREDHFDMSAGRIETHGGWMMLTFTPTPASRWWWHSRIWNDAKAHHDKCKQHNTRLEPDDWWTHQASLATRDPHNRSEYEVGRVLVPHFRRIFDRRTRAYIPNPDCECEEAGICNACRQRTVEFAKNYHSDALERRIRIFGEIPNSLTRWAKT